MKAFYATAEKVLQIQNLNQAVISVIKGDQLICESDHIDQTITDHQADSKGQLIIEMDQKDQTIMKYFQEVFIADGHQVDYEADIDMWTRLDAAVV